MKGCSKVLFKWIAPLIYPALCLCRSSYRVNLCFHTTTLECIFQGNNGNIIMHFQGALEDFCHVVGCKPRLVSQHDSMAPLCLQTEKWSLAESNFGGLIPSTDLMYYGLALMRPNLNYAIL